MDIWIESSDDDSAKYVKGMIRMKYMIGRRIRKKEEKKRHTDYLPQR